MITNLSANNSPSAIRRYRDNYDQAFNAPPPDDAKALNDKEINDNE